MLPHKKLRFGELVEIDDTVFFYVLQHWGHEDQEMIDYFRYVLHFLPIRIDYLFMNRNFYAYDGSQVNAELAFSTNRNDMMSNLEKSINFQTLLSYI